MHHFLQRAKETNDWQEDQISQEQILQLLIAKIESVAFDSVKEDVVRFIADDQKLAIWSPNYFKDLIQKMKFE
jgi:hypothetical protein